MRVPAKNVPGQARSASVGDRDLKSSVGAQRAQGFEFKTFFVAHETLVIQQQAGHYTQAYRKLCQAFYVNF